jgi:TRAP transporter TAXI family solute receptor
MKFNKLILLTTIFFLSSGLAFCQMIILSGPEKGSYNSFAGDIVSVLGDKNGIKLLNRTTGGSAYNFKQLTGTAPGDKMALIQSDYMNLMKAEDKLNNTNKTGSLKVVLQLAPEEIHFVAKRSSGLKKLQDLENKKVAVGQEDQGSSATGKLIKERSKVNWTTFYAGYDQLLSDLSTGKIDAFLLVGSAPVSLLEIDPQTMTDGGTLLELEDFNGWAKYYENDTIYASDYKWLEKDIPTFSVRTLLVVNEAKLTNAEKQTVEAIRSGIIQNLDVLRKQGHPKWKEVIVPDEPGVVSEIKTTTDKTPAPVSAVTKDEVVYKVQLYSRNYQQKEEQVVIDGKSYQTWVYSYLGAYRYTIGEFTALSSAVELQTACRKSGYEGAFVAAFKNNARTTDQSLFK